MEWKADAIIDGHTSVEYAWLLDETGEPRLELANAFLKWYMDMDGLQDRGDKWAKKWMTACATIARSKLGKPRIVEGAFFSRYEETRVIQQAVRDKQSASRIANGKEVAQRCDHTPTFEEMELMLTECLSGNSEISTSELDLLQLAFSVRVSHVTGCRGQLMRTGSKVPSMR